MKNVTTYLHIVMLVCFITSCTNNDDNINFAAEIEGKWRLTSLESLKAYDFNNDGQPSNNMLLETNCYLNELMVFNTDNTADLKKTSFSKIIATLVPGTTNDYTFATGCINEESAIVYKWAIDGDNVILIDEQGIETKLLPVESNQFSFSLRDSLVVRRSGDQTVLIEDDFRFTYTKE